MTLPLMPIEKAEVLGDMPCRKCGYNLRGLGVEGKCPECGTAVSLSVSGDLLRYSDPEWLGGLKRGVNWIIWGMVVTILMGIATGIFIAALGMAGRYLLAMGAQAMSIWGWWVLTRPDPSGIGEDRYGTSRKIIRIGLIAGAITTFSAFFGEQQVGILHEITTLISGLGQLVVSVAMIAELQYLKKLAIRIPDDRLAKRAGFLQYALGISYGMLVLVGMGFKFVFQPTRPGLPLIGIGMVMGIAGLALLVFGIMYLLMIEKFGRQFKEQAAFARESWAMQVGAK